MPVTPPPDDSAPISIGTDDVLVVSAVLDWTSQRWLDAWRREFFPPERSGLPAHLTMFHALPGRHADSARRDVEVAVAAGGALTAAVTGMTSLGRGVAVQLASVELQELREELASAWRPWLTRQDAQRWRPHVTVQNKVEPAVARETLHTLSARPYPPTIGIQGVRLSRYAGGPWQEWATATFPGSDDLGLLAD